MARGNFLNQAFNTERDRRAKLSPTGSSFVDEIVVNGVRPRPVTGPGPISASRLADIDPGPIDIPIDRDIVGAQAPDLSRMAEDDNAPSGSRKRRGLLDTLGKLSDVLATAGGEEGAYMSALQAQEDRQRANEQFDLLKRTGEQKLTMGGLDIQEAQNAFLEKPIRGLRMAFQQAGPEGLAQTWAELAPVFNVPPDKAQQISAMLQQDPERAISILEEVFGDVDGTEFGLNPLFATDPQGNTAAFQLSKTGSPRQVGLPEGFNIAEGQQFVDTGGAKVPFGKRTGTQGTPLAVSGGPAEGEVPVGVDNQGNPVYRPAEGSKLSFERQQLRGELKAAFPKLQSSFNVTTRDIDKQIKAINSLVDHEGLGGITGSVEGRLPSILPSSSNAQAVLDNIKATATFNELQEMRNNSPTGGALGQVSNAENTRLENAAARLVQTQTKEAFQEALRDYKSELQFSKRNLAEAFAADKAILNERTGGSVPPVQVNSALEKAIAERNRRRGR